MNNPSQKNPDQIRHEIEATRREIGETVEGIQHKMEPSNLRHEAKQKVADLQDSVAEGVRHLADNTAAGFETVANRVIDFVRDNPGPSVLIGLGLAWLAANSRRPDYEDEIEIDINELYESEHEDGNGRYSTMKTAVGKVNDLAAGTGQSLRETSGAVKHRMSDATRGIRTRAREARSGFGHFAEDYPVALIAGCFAVGLAIGFALPVTEKEQEVIGPRRDALLSSASEIASEFKHVMKQSISAARQRAADELQASTLTEDTAAEVKRIASVAAEEARVTAQDELES